MTEPVYREAWGVPYYWLDHQLRVVRRLNGQTTTGRFRDGRFVEDLDQGDTLHDPCGDM
ncbi:hypothetical protein MARCHEWKA_00100 [Brevundimonas phage vB_BpoS-Marchewka]|uniref:Uncharacterized protein n=1 Tax=Brevundimonas phage vB_BpoS-Marchewka TaxID=2948604 RepID=A0A9E7N294_9CAUD|nr:hypothetical protein MARCHEWKA_00100 [Brevundimonas phage vB_BpoS-Marchewka]UTC29532.1 hypothetical protein BAMBUS_04580 [Brevundimonas phage vB_BpoS-Bambus]